MWTSWKRRRCPNSLSIWRSSKEDCGSFTLWAANAWSKVLGRPYWRHTNDWQSNVTRRNPATNTTPTWYLNWNIWNSYPSQGDIHLILNSVSANHWIYIENIPPRKGLQAGKECVEFCLFLPLARECPQAARRSTYFRIYPGKENETLNKLKHIYSPFIADVPGLHVLL